jgi:hypothetical protein
MPAITNSEPVSVFLATRLYSASRIRILLLTPLLHVSMRSLPLLRILLTLKPTSEPRNVTRPENLGLIPNECIFTALPVVPVRGRIRVVITSVLAALFGNMHYSHKQSQLHLPHYLPLQQLVDTYHQGKPGYVPALSLLVESWLSLSLYSWS